MSKHGLRLGIAHRHIIRLIHNIRHQMFVGDGQAVRLLLMYLIYGVERVYGRRIVIAIAILSRQMSAICGVLSKRYGCGHLWRNAACGSHGGGRCRVEIVVLYDIGRGEMRIVTVYAPQIVIVA